MGNQDPQDPGANEKNFTPPASTPDQFANEGPGGYAQEPEQEAPASPQEEAPPQPAGGGLTPFQQHFADFWHGKGMSDAGIAGMLGTAHYEAPQGYTSYNPTSGASGSYQYLGSRAEQEQAYAQQHGLDPWHPDAQNGYAYSEIQPNGPEYDSTGKYLWHAADPRMAADVMVRGFERPGPVDTPIESSGAQRVAASLYPAIQARYAQAAGQPPADPTGVDVAIDRLLKSEGPTGQGKFDHQILPPTVTTPQPSPVTDSVNRLLEQEDAANKQAGQAKQAPMPPGYDWGSLGSALLELPRGIPMGFLSKLGLPADVFNFMQHYYQEHPADASQVGIYGVPLPPEAQTQLDKEAAAGVKPPSGLQMLEQAIAHPSSLFQTDNKATLEAAKGMPQRVPLGTEDLANAVKYATGIDLHQQDQSTGGMFASDIGQFIGAGATPFAAAKGAIENPSALLNVTKKTVLGGILHNILMPAGASGGLDLGKIAVDKYSPDQGTANAIGIGSRIALGVAGTALAHRGMEIAGEASKAAGEGISAPGQVSTAFKSVYKGDEAAANAAKAQASQEIADHNPDTLLPGYEAPAALRTASLPIQQMYHDMVQKDMILRGRADRNAIVLQEGMRPEGDAQDAVTAVQNMQNTRQQTIDHSIDLLKEESEQKMLAAQQSSTGRTLQPGDTKNQFDLGQTMVDGLNATRDDWFAHADNQWDIAREHGYLDVQAPVNAMYGKLGEEMAKNIQQRQGADFPWQIVGDLYSKDAGGGGLVRGGGANPQTGLFDAYGNRLTNPTAFPLLKEGQTSLDDLKAVDSRLGNAIRMEQGRISAPGQGGNPALLKSMVQVRNHIWDAIQTGAANAGQDHTVALQTAMDATAQAYNTFVHGGLSRLLNEQGGAAIAPDELNRYLGTSLKAVNSADAFSKAIAGRTGAADTRAGNPHLPPAQLQDQTWNTMADWLRQTYLNAYHNGSPGTGQKWLNNHVGFFDQLKGNPIIDNLRTELQEHANASSPARTGAINEAQKQLQSDLDKSAAGIFLGKPQARLNAVFGARDPGMAMTQLMQDTVKADPTLNAFHGLQRMLWDRLSMEAERGGDPLRPGENYYSGKQAKEFLDANKPAFDAMRKADPAFGQRLDRLVNTLAIEDRSRVAPGLELPQSVAKAKPWSPLSSGSVRVFQLAAGSLGRHILPKVFGGGMVSSMQASAQASAFAREIAQHLPESGLLNKIPDPVGDARRAIEDALFDPEKMRGLLAPINGKSGQKWAAGLEPWLRASGVMLPQGFLNPEEPPQGEPGQ